MNSYFRFFLICLSMLYLAPSLFAKSLAEFSEYPQFCQLAARDPSIYANFKRNPCYNQTLEHLVYAQGLLFLNIIQNDYPNLFPYFELFRQNDVIGNPNIYNYDSVGWFSPTTLRYIKIAGDLQKIFGDTSQLRVLEIGAGYGGQCKILSDLNAFSTYAIIDLAECNPLTEKYLSNLGVKNVTCIDRNDLDRATAYDLVISNYAFSEIEKEEQTQYLEKIIAHIPRGYMILNFFSNYHTYSAAELVEFLHAKGYQARIEEEIPSTADGHNRLLIWKPN